SSELAGLIADRVVLHIHVKAALRAEVRLIDEQQPVRRRDCGPVHEETEKGENPEKRTAMRTHRVEIHSDRAWYFFSDHRHFKIVRYAPLFLFAGSFGIMKKRSRENYLTLRGRSAEASADGPKPDGISLVTHRMVRRPEGRFVEAGGKVMTQTLNPSGM